MRPRPDVGFTLTELLVVITLLGVLAAITVAVMQGLPERAESSGRATDEATLRKAEEAYLAKQTSSSPVYATEAELVSGGLLKAPSSLHDVCLSPDKKRYKIVASGTDCTTVAV